MWVIAKSQIFVSTSQSSDFPVCLRYFIFVLLVFKRCPDYLHTIPMLRWAIFFEAAFPNCIQEEAQDTNQTFLDGGIYSEQSLQIPYVPTPEEMPCCQIKERSLLSGNRDRESLG